VPLSDENLVLRFQAGDQDAFEELFLRYRDKAYALALRMLRHPDMAADVVQETFLRLCKGLRRFRGEASFSTYLYRVVSNLCMDEIRRRQRGQQVSMSVSGEEGGRQREIAGGLSDPEEELVRKEYARRVEEALGRLPEDYRLAVVLRDVHGLSYEEMAAVMQCPLGTVKSRLSRARGMLRDILTEMELLPPGHVKTGEGRETR